MSTTHLHIHLFGAFSFVYDDQTIAPLHVARLQSLLAFLLLHRDAAQTRQQIAFRFWPETSDKQAQTNLRQLLHRLKRRLPNADDYLLMDERSVGWRSAAVYTLDVAEFEQAMLAASRADGIAKIAALERMATAYTGDLLPDCYDEWIIPLRERLAQQFVTALEQLVLLHEERRNYAAAIAHAQRLLGYDPLHEATYRRLMRLFALTGDRPAALRVYHTCVSMLEQELDVPPSTATREAYERLLRVDGALAQPRPARLPFVGRQVEWQALQTLWRSVSRGALRVVCIEGEAGLGKTRLVEELLHWAQQQGIGTLHSRAYAAEGGLVYAPLVEWLRSAPLQSAIADLPAVRRSELAHLLPELLISDPTLPVPEPLTERWQRQRLFEAVVSAVVPKDRPLMLALDDLQWCDEETLAWLLFLVHHNPRARLLLITTLRSDELAREHLVVDFLLELRRLDLLGEFELSALDAAETTALAEGIAEQKLDASQAERLYTATEGNPLFIVETMRSQLITSDVPASPLALPPKVSAVIRARLAQLSPPARDLAQVAATIGRSFSVDVLTAACEHDEQTVVRSLDELWQRRIVREHGVSDYDFSHDRLREVAYAGLQPARRRLLHHRVATALDRLHPNATGALCVQLAHHYEQSGLLEQAVHSLQRAAASARDVYANRDAIALLERALSLLHALPEAQVRLEIELEVQMALCAAWDPLTSHLGKEVEAAYSRALELCRLVRQTPHLFTVLWGLHEIALYRGDYRESLELATQCLQIASDLDDVSLMLEAHHAMWAPHFFLGEYRQAFVHMEAGLTLYDRRWHEPLSTFYGAHDAGACALTELPLALWTMGFLDQARRRLDAAVAHAQQLTIPANIADGCGYAALSFHLLRDPVQAQRFAEPALRIFSEKGMFNAQYMAATTLGWSLAMQGQHAEGVALARQGINVCRQAQHRLHVSQLTCMLAEACMVAGHVVEAVDVLDDALVDFGRTHDLICAPDLHTLKGDALLLLGADEGEACYQAALSLAQKLGAKTSELRAATGLARLRQNQGRFAEAMLALEAIYGWFTEGFDTPDLVAAKALLDELGRAVQTSEILKISEV
jgi:DNA-binding SARP family transcriptional activator